MKKIYTAVFISTLLSINTKAQFNISIGYAMSLPQQKMNENINALHSLALGGMYQLPGKLSRVQVGADLGWGTYASTTKQQTFTFRNGTSTITDVLYGSNVLQANATARVLLTEKKLVTPYVSGKAGFASFYSTIFIEDPLDPHGCAALDQSTIIKDGSMFTAVGGGLQLDAKVFSKNSRKGRTFIDISVHSVQGGNVDYINTRKLYDAANPPTDSNGKPLNVQFINATTNEIHEHQVAEVFTSPLRMLEFRVAARFSLK